MQASDTFSLVESKELDSVLEEIEKTFKTSQRLICLEAEKKTSSIENFQNDELLILKAMPNTRMFVDVGILAISDWQNTCTLDIKAVEGLSKA